MIQLTKINGQPVFVNPDLVRLVERTPDTVLSFVDDQKLVVKESPEEITKKIIEFRKTYMAREGKWT